MSEVFKGYGASAPKETLKPIEYSPAPLEDDQVQIKITYNGLCHTDIHMKDNDWGITTYPLIPGHEVVGVVEKVGAHVKHLKVGDNVGVGWIRNACGDCPNCVKGYENLCSAGYTGTVVGNHGGFQDRLRISAHWAFKLPEKLDPAIAGPLLCAGCTVFAPLKENVEPGMRVGVIGIGGLGHIALQFARAFGAEVYAFSSGSSKEADAKKFGAHHYVNSSDPVAFAAVKNSLDIILDTAPCPVDWKAYIDILRPGGKFLLVGLPAAEITVPVLPIVFYQKSISGSIVAGRKLTLEMLNFAAVHNIIPQIEYMPLAECNEAIIKVLKNEARYRIVLVSPPS